MSLVHFNNINTIKICVANNYLKHWKPILPVWAIESRERLNTKIDIYVRKCWGMVRIQQCLIICKICSNDHIYKLNLYQ